MDNNIDEIINENNTLKRRVNELEELLKKYKSRIKSAEKTFDESLILRTMKMEYEAEELGEWYKKLRRYEIELDGKIKELRAKEHNNQFCFITVSPKESVSLEEFKKAIEKCVTRNMFKSYLYVYEQMGKTTDELGKGFHAHVLVKRNLNYKPSKIAINLKNTFKSITNVNNPQVLNIQHIGEDFAKHKIEYMTSINTGEGNDVKQEVDVVWREEIGLLPYYGDKDINKYSNK